MPAPRGTASLNVNTAPGRAARANRKRARGRPQVSPTGPYPAQSSVKSIREKATPAEKQVLTKSPTRTGRRVRRLARRDQEVSRRSPGSTPGTSRPIETLKRAEAKLTKESNARLREASRRLRHALAEEAAFKARRKTAEGTAIEANKPKVGLKAVAPRAYEKARQAALPGGHRSSRGLGEPEDLTTAITLAVPGGGLAGALGKRAAEAGGKVVAKEVGEAAAAKIESTGGKVVARALNAGSGVRAGGRLAGKAALRAAGRDTTRISERAAESAASRAGRRAGAKAAAERSRAASAAVPGIKAAKIGALGTPAVRGHVQAVVENPKKTAKTTARAIPGLVTYPVGVAIKAGVTAGRAASEAAHTAGVPGAAGYSVKEILAPVAHIPAEQLAFAKQLAKVATSSDAAEVQREVEDNLGLTLPIMLGLGSKAAGEKISKGRITEAVRRIAEHSRERHGKAHGYREGKAPRVLERTGQRKEAAKIAARGRTRIRSELSDRQRGMLEAARGATNSEVVRKGVVRGKRGKKLDLSIRDADVASFLQRHPMKLDDPVSMLAEVKRIESRLKPIPKGHEPSPSQLMTRDVIEHIKRRPDVLANPAVIRIVREYRAQGAHAREHAAELAPEHSERARFLTAASTRDIPFPEERFPKGVRAIVRAAPERGRLAKDVLRKESRRDRARAKQLRRKAATAERKAAIMRRELEVREKANKTKLEQPLAPWQKRELAAVKAMERRGMVPRERMPVGGHLQLVTPKEARLPKATLPKAHERLRERIDKLDTHAATLKEKAALAEQMAKQKHKAAREVDTSLTPEFAGEVQARLRKEGITELPEYQHAGPGREHGAPVYGSSGTKLAQFAGKSKMRKGTAEDFGLVEEGLRPMIRESIARPVSRRESYKAARDVLERNRFNAGGKVEWSAREADELFRGADPVLSPEQWMKVPRQFYKRIYDVLEGKGKGKGIGEQDFKMIGELEALRDGKGAPGSHYQIVRSAGMNELVDQLSNALVAPKLAKANRATSFLILGTSPAWAAMQVIAEYGQGAVAQPKLLNPAFVKRAVAAYKEMSPRKRQAFDSWVGVTTRTIDKAADLKLDLKAGDMDAAHNAYKTLEGTPYGRFLRGIPTSIQRIDAWKGGRIRALTALAKVDKDLNGRANTFIRGVGGMNREMKTALKEMAGKPLRQQAEWVAEHPQWARRYQGYLDDVMGNWSALTKNERVAAQAMIFYPFLRMSLRWTFYAFPKRHPIKAAMLYGLGQMNAQEVEKLLHGDPSYFTQWAMVPIDLGGEKKLIDLSRIAPGSNALVEALGGSTEGPKGIAAAKVAQPVLAALGTAVYGVSPLSGKQEPGSGWNALAQLLSLSPVARVAGEATIPAGRKKAAGTGQLPVVGSFSTERQAALDKLSAKLNEYGTPQRLVRQLVAPPYPKDAGKEADKARLTRVLKQLDENSTDNQDALAAQVAFDKRPNVGMRGVSGALKRKAKMEAAFTEAQDALNALFDKYGIAYKREQEVGLTRYGAIKYGSSGDSSNPWSGGGSSSSSNPWAGSSSSSSSSNPWSAK